MVTERTKKAKPCNSPNEIHAPEKLFESALKAASQLHTPKFIKSASKMKNSATLSAFTPASIRKVDHSNHLRDNSYFTKAMAVRNGRQSALCAKELTVEGATGAATDRTIKHASPFQRANNKPSPVQIGKKLKEKLHRELLAVKSKIQTSNQDFEAQKSSKPYSQMAAEDTKKSKLGFLKDLFAPTHKNPVHPPFKPVRKDFAVQMLFRFEDLSKARLGAFNPFEAKSKPPRVYGFREIVFKETNEIFTIEVEVRDSGFTRKGTAPGARPFLLETCHASAGAAFYSRVPQAIQERYAALTQG